MAGTGGGGGVEEREREDDGACITGKGLPRMHLQSILRKRGNWGET